MAYNFVYAGGTMPCYLAEWITMFQGGVWQCDRTEKLDELILIQRNTFIICLLYHDTIDIAFIAKISQPARSYTKTWAMDVYEKSCGELSPYLTLNGQP